MLQWNIRRWKDSPCSRIYRINIGIMARLSKSSYRFNVIKISMSFSTKTEKNYLQIHMETKRSVIAKAILSKKEQWAMLEVSQYLTSTYTTERKWKSSIVLA
jgi:hypothetical protein